ncbi:MAG: hypothetical protein H0W44_06615 [Gammaproteobacteria bacterium]|nr:hypothetical protein [Gammaproteobacteria bacterium]
MNRLLVLRARVPLLFLPLLTYGAYCHAVEPAHAFLQFLNKSAPQFQETQTTAEAYYAAIDPANLRLTHDAFKTFNALSDSNAAVYVNEADLGFGRRMYVKTNADGSVASCVENYAGPAGSVNAPAQVKIDSAKAHLASELLATVCMEYTGTPSTESPSNGIPNTAIAPNVLLSGRKFVKFFAYDGVGRRIYAADLDGEGAKFMPGLCNVCHGGEPKSLLSNGTYPNNGDTNTYFLPWDLDTLLFDTAVDNNRATLEPRLKTFNQAVLATYPLLPVNGIPEEWSTPTPVKMIYGWYGGKTLPNPTFNGAYIPSGWLAINNPTAPANTEILYTQVVAPNCRACHAQRGGLMRNQLTFNSYKDFMLYARQIEHLVYDLGVMPLAKRTHEYFWSGSQAAILAAHMPRYKNGYNGQKPGDYLLDGTNLEAGYNYSYEWSGW